jgi:hypothetical protein
MGLINASIIHNHVIKLPISSSIRVSVNGVVGGLCSTVNVRLLTWGGLLL